MPMDGKEKPKRLSRFAIMFSEMRAGIGGQWSRRNVPTNNIYVDQVYYIC